MICDQNFFGQQMSIRMLITILGICAAAMMAVAVEDESGGSLDIEPVDHFNSSADFVSEFSDFLQSTEESEDSHERWKRGCPRIQTHHPEYLYGEWSRWSPCSRTCGGGGLQHRRRQCAANNPNCQSAESRPCGQRPCSPGWSEWCEWGDCRAECGVGERMRIRFCEGGTLRCPGKDYQLQHCNAGRPCPGWWDWAEWSACSTSCGMGKQHRERNCHDPQLCRGERTAERECNNGPCPPRGQQSREARWSTWSEWSQCDRPCGGGLTHRRRVCHPRREQCRGADSEHRRCNDFVCHGRCQWTTWAAWTPCVPLPGFDCAKDPNVVGVRERIRHCVGRGVQCGWSCPGGHQDARQRESCPLSPNANPCRRG